MARQVERVVVPLLEEAAATLAMVMTAKKQRGDMFKLCGCNQAVLIFKQGHHGS